MSAPQLQPTPIVRTFRAADPRQALDAVRMALGSDAVIIDTREVGGGLWGRPQIEITASLGAPIPARPGEGTVQDELGALRRVVEELRSSMPGGRAAGAGAGVSVSLGAQAPAGRPDAVAFYKRLVRRGLEPNTAERLVRQALEDDGAGAGGANGGKKDLRAAVAELVGKQLAVAPPPWQGRPGTRTVMAVVGPTGVGKTTTIAKIAARALLESRRKVALITVDNYRIGAREHLARYGEIMRLPLHVARDRATLATALAACGDADLVLIDSAGRSDAEAIAAQGALVRSAPGVELHLVLSAASGAIEMRGAARRFQGLGPSRLIFTKLDEAEGPASLLAAALALPRPVSCIANGQRVPDDLHQATQSNLTELVVGPPARS